MIKNRFLLMLLSFMALNAVAQPTMPGGNPSPAGGGSLPACSGPNPQNWDNCQGTFTYGNGNVYTGEFHQGMRQGKGKIRIVAKGQSTSNYIGSDIPSTYEGEWRNNKINGYGVWTTDKGQKFAGYFVDNIYQGPNPTAQQAAPQQSQQQAPQRTAAQQQVCDNLAQKIKENDESMHSFSNALGAMSASANGGAAKAQYDQNNIQKQQLGVQLNDQYMRYCQ